MGPAPDASPGGYKSPYEPKAAPAVQATGGTYKSPYGNPEMDRARNRPSAPQEVGQGTRTTLADWGIPTERIAALLAGGTVIEPQEAISAE